MDSFDEMALRETLLRGIYAYGFEKPSAIQQRAILPCIKGEYSTTPTFQILRHNGKIRNLSLMGSFKTSEQGTCHVNTAWSLQ